MGRMLCATALVLAVACQNNSAPVVSRGSGELTVGKARVDFREAGQERTLKLWNTGTGRVRIDALEITGPYVDDFEWELPFTLEAGAKADLAVRAKGPPQDGTLLLRFARERLTGGMEPRAQRVILKAPDSAGSAARCVTDNPCRPRALNAQGTCVEEALNKFPCDDGNRLTIDDTCVRGTCVGKHKDGAVIPDGPSDEDPLKRLKRSSRRSR